MAAKKTTRRPRKSGAARTATKARKPAAARASRPPPPTLQQELLQMAQGGAQSVAQMLRVLVVLVLVAGAATGLWLLRPVPSYSSDDVTAGSPFEVTFRVENKDPWFPLANLKISCVLAHVRGEPMTPTLVEATNVRLAGNDASRLESGESGTFTCPFLAFLEHETKDDPGVATRAEIYFRSEYDLPRLGWFRLTDNSARFFLDTRLLPPRWVSKPK